MSRDLVERQEIIDHLDRVIEKGLVNILSGEHPITAEVMKEVIMALPSAEPEIIRCRNCKHSHLTYDGKNKYCVHWPNGEYLDGGFYCGFAKRREE